jgi:hypothetical protein
MPKTVIQYVLGRLKDIGIDDIFAVAGDFAFPIHDAIVQDPDINYGTGPALIPNAVPNASRCGDGRLSRWPRVGASNWCNPANASSISDWTPAARITRQSAALVLR